MAKKQFKAESKRLLDLMINSIYTHKEIFLRELISNASDAIDKLYYRSLTDGLSGMNREDFSIRIDADKDARTLTITDNGIGMTKEELEKNLGTIARSGSLDFKAAMDQAGAAKAGEEGTDLPLQNETIDIIGQFGVGFYSAFMVSDKVTVLSKAYGSEEAWQWESTGADGYTVKEAEKDGHGTVITLVIKEDTEDERYTEFMEEYRIRSLVRKYSDYIRYPIQMMVEKSRPKDAEGETSEDKAPEYETYFELETLNSMVPLWKKQKSSLTDEDYNRFYKEKYYDMTDPVKVIHTNVEGLISYTALLFIPGQAPYDYYSKDFEKGLQLYSSGVMIMDKCPDLLPDYFSFVRGLVDSQDLSLNISREMLQHDRQLKAIAQRLEKKIKSELLDMLNKDREKYAGFFKNFGLQLKYGVYEGFGMNKDKLQDLLIYYSTFEGDAGSKAADGADVTENADGAAKADAPKSRMVTLAEYVSRMKPDQKFIYYAVGESIEKIDKMPQTEVLKDRGYEILYMTEDVDEFAIQMLREYDGKEFKSVSADDLELEETAEEKEAAKKQEEETKDLLAYMKEALEGKVSDVRLTQRLKSHPVCLTAKGGLSIEMEKVLNAMPMDEKVKADRVLELNAGHKIVDTLNEIYKTDKEKVKTYAELLYNQALLIEGLQPEDPVAFSNAICDIMTDK